MARLLGEEGERVEEQGLCNLGREAFQAGTPSQVSEGWRKIASNLWGWGVLAVIWKPGVRWRESCSFQGRE